MSNTEETGPSSNPASAPIVGYLSAISKIAGLLLAISASVYGLYQNVCKLPMLSVFCQVPPDPPIPVGPKSPAGITEAEFEKRVVALGASRDVALEGIDLRVYHQPPSQDPLVLAVLVGLRAAGFNVGLNVNQVRVSLDNVQHVDRTPGLVWVKSAAGRKALRAAAREAILKALPASYDSVRISDVDLPDARGGEIQVDVF